MITPNVMTKRNPNFWVRMVEIQANKNMHDVWMDAIQDTVLALLFNFFITEAKITPKLQSIPLTIALFIKAQKQITQAKIPSFSTYSVLKGNRFVIL